MTLNKYNILFTIMRKYPKQVTEVDSPNCEQYFLIYINQDRKYFPEVVQTEPQK